MKPISSTANIQFNFGTTSNEHRRNGVQWVARLRPGRNIKLGPNKHHPELDCQFSSQHFHLVSPPSYPGCFHGSAGAISAPPPALVVAALGAGWWVAHPGWVGAACSAPNQPAELQTHTWPSPTSSRHHCFQGFNELAAFLQSTYLPPCAGLLPPRSHPACSQAQGERNYLLCAC